VDDEKSVEKLNGPVREAGSQGKDLGANDEGEKQVKLD